jgi:branched-subunit amino acid transport protein
MEVSPDFLRMLLGVSLVTLLSRTLPLIFVSKIKIPAWGMAFLKHIPTAVMTGLVVQSLLTDGDVWLPLQGNKQLIAFIPTLAIALLTRSLLAAVGAGILAMMCINLL